MFSEYTKENYKEGIAGLHNLAESKTGQSAAWLKGEGKKISKHFLKDLKEFDVTAVERIGRKIVGRKATILSDGDGVAVTLLLVDEQGECYDTLEAADNCNFPILSQDEIYQRARGVRKDEHTCKGCVRQDPQAEEDFDLRLTRNWEEYLGVSFPETDFHCD